MVPENEEKSPNTTQEVRWSTGVEQFQQAEAHDMPSAREFKSADTVTSGDVIQERVVKCGCTGQPPRPPPPPPIPPEILRRIFPDQDIKQELLSRKGFREKVKKELKNLLRKNSTREMPEPPQESRKPTSPPSPPPPPPPSMSVKLKPTDSPPSMKSISNHPDEASMPNRKGKTMRVKVIDLMKNWKPLVDFRDTQSSQHDPKGKKGDNYGEKTLNEREIVRQFAMEFTRPRTRSSGVSVVATNVLMYSSGVFLALVISSL